MRTTRHTTIDRHPGSRRIRRTARGLAAVGALLAASGGALAAAVPAGASTLGGTATVAQPGLTTPLTSGGSTTPFTVSLPAQAACTGDTATGGYHVYSYLVHKGTALSTVTFVNSPSTGYGYVEGTGTYYGAVNTAIGTGQIIGIPNDFVWAPLVANDGVTLAQLLYSGSGSSASGTWESGIACADTHGTVTDNWNAEVVFSASSTDPTGFTWTALPTGSAAPAFTSAATTTFTEGSAGTFSPVATGSPTPTVTESGTLPAGVTFSGGVLGGTPTTAGSFPITFTASNGIGSAAHQSFVLTVAAATTPTTTTTTTAPGATTTTTTTDPGSTTTTTTTASPVVAADTASGGSGSAGTGGSSGGALAFTGFHTAKGLGLGLLGIGLGLMLLGWGYRAKIRPARLARNDTP